MEAFDMRENNSSNELSNNKSITDPEIWEQNLASKVESQRWCLGFHQKLQYNTELNGVVLSNQSLEEHVSEVDRGSVQYVPTDSAGFVMMPANGSGWTSNPGTPDHQRWGEPRLVNALIAIATEWKARGHAPIVIGDISLKSGGPFAPHASHQKGIDVDLRPIGYRSGRSIVGGNNYSRELTREFIELIKNNGHASVLVIGFQDPIFVAEGLTKDWDGHRDHLHVRFK